MRKGCRTVGRGSMKYISRRSAWYSAAGAILAVGGPAGLLIVRELYAPRPVATELSSERLTYLYVLISTAIVLAVLGFLLGDRRIGSRRCRKPTRSPVWRTVVRSGAVSGRNSGVQSVIGPPFRCSLSTSTA
jgi:hypothetical protein